MSPGADEDGHTVLAPEEAFSVLGNDTRMQILQTLAGADEPLSFSELRRSVGMRHGGQFNYHLDKLVGHFVENTDDGYELLEPGRRVIEAVVSGAVTDTPVLEPTPIDEPCPRCDGDTVVAYSRERVEHYCTECDGHYGPARDSSQSATSIPGSAEGASYGYLGSFSLPSAGVHDRTPEEVFRAASTWGILELLAVASGVCPRCSAPLANSVDLCESHDPTGGVCEQCNNRHAIMITYRCPNCPFRQRGAFVLALMAQTDLLAFLITHGINPVSPTDEAAHDAALMNYEEELLSAEPFEARFTFTVDTDSLTLTVDDDLNVVEVREE